MGRERAQIRGLVRQDAVLALVRVGIDEGTRELIEALIADADAWLTLHSQWRVLARKHVAIAALLERMRARAGEKDVIAELMGPGLSMNGAWEVCRVAKAYGTVYIVRVL